MKKEITNLETSIIILLSSIIGFSLGGIYYKSKNPPAQIIKEIERCQCAGLTSEDVRLIIRQQFVPAFEFNYAVDGAIEEARLVPLIKKICK